MWDGNEIYHGGTSDREGARLVSTVCVRGTTSTGVGRLKTRDWKTWDQIALVEIAGPENAGPKFHGWKRQDWKTREHHVYG